ncbi:MAG: CpaF family protein [Candidatus Diapherotrites archaeon]|uniref:CpaF family protein n=1 Tax=Candidatus Iainarchaeum sp. TaxID=3101447 RepID=A0A939C6T2_9ARCH|nr:CpaF family protein [Candidatus Diapherotrites archaeon]
MRAENVLGWNLLNRERATEIWNGPSSSIRQNQEGEKTYSIEAFPRLSFQEAMLLRNAMQELHSSSSRLKKEQAREFLKQYCIGSLIELDRQQAEYCSLLLEKMVFGFGPLDFLLQDDDIEEIALIGTGKGKPVHVFHCRQGWLKTNLFFSSGSSVKDLVNRMASCIGRRLTANSPVLNALLPDGSRLNATIRPVSFTGPSFTIRKFRKKPFTPVQLIESGTFSAELMAFLWLAMQSSCSILIAGNTGSGKTTTLNALFSFVPKDERVVVVEETPEIRLPHSHIVKLNVVKEQGISMQSLIVDTLRMRPDRIVVGEVRSKAETKAFVDTLLAGQGKGSYATFHGQSCEEALNRMRAFGIEEQDLAGIDIVLVQRRWDSIENGKAKERRIAVEACELERKQGRISINPVFRYNFKKSGIEKVGESARAMEMAEKCFGMQKSGLEREIEKRAALLESWIGKGLSIEEFFRAVGGK